MRGEDFAYDLALDAATPPLLNGQQGFSSKAADPQRCDLHQKAREACKDKVGPDHMACLRAQFGVK